MSPEELGRWLFAIAKHLKVYQAQDRRLAFLFATLNSAKDGDLLLRLRGIGTVSREKLEALALDASIAPQEVPNSVKRLEKTGLVSVFRSASTREIANVTERIFTEQEVFRAIAEIFDSFNPSASERAMAPLLDTLSRLPLTEEEALARICAQGYTEKDAKGALELLEAFRLLHHQIVSDLGVTLYYNEYLWGHKIEQLGTILGRLGRRETEGLLALLEEVRTAQGKPLDQLRSAPPNIVALAARTGILDTTTIITASGDRKAFVFSPQFYGYRTGPQLSLIADPADQVKLFVASITYGVHHSIDFRLHSPLAFVRALLRNGEAGNATPIARDYVLLEKQGIVAVKLNSSGRGTFVLQKHDIVEQALDVMTNGTLLRDEEKPQDTRTLAVCRRENLSGRLCQYSGPFHL